MMSKNKANTNISELAKSQGLMAVDTNEIIDELAISILRSMYRYEDQMPAAPDSFVIIEGKPGQGTVREEKPSDVLSQERSDWAKEVKDQEAMNAKIESAYKEWTGQNWREDREKVLSTFLIGPPGHGKTTAFKQASRKVASALGLIYLENPTEEVRVTKEHFLFTSLEFSAENSKMELGGIPAKKTVDGVEYMARLTQYRLATLKNASGGLLLLDDFSNASQNIQNLGLSLTDEKRYQGLNLQGIYIGLTGNMGALDGTNTSRVSSALRGRCEIYFTQDKLANFTHRARLKYRDDLGDAGFIGFLNKNEDYFAVVPDPKQSGGYPAPRTLDHAIGEVRRLVYDNGGRGTGELKAMDKIIRKVSAIIGMDAGHQYGIYLTSLMNSADPLARKIIFEGKLDEKSLQQAYDNGFSANSQYFGYQYALALAEYAVNRIAKNEENESDDKVLEETCKRFMSGLIPLEGANLGFAVDNFKLGLALKREDWSKASTNERSLNTDIKTKICQAFTKVPGFSKDLQQTVVDAITDADKYEATSSYRQRRSSGN